MASPLLIVLAASGLAASGVPAANNVSAVKPVALVTPATNAKSGMCLIPTIKGRPLKLSDYRKALKGKTCANQFMQAGGAAAGAGGAAGSVTAATVATGVSVAAAGSALGLSVSNATSTPAP